MNREQCLQANQDDEYEHHKAIHRAESFPIEMRAASGDWLAAHGFLGLDGRMLITSEGLRECQ